MRRIIFSLGLLLAAASPSFAANSTVSTMTAASALGGTELLYAVQGGADRKATPAQMAAYVYGLMSGDATTSGLGAITFATVNSNVGSFGSTTNCVSLTVNAKGLITAASAATCAPAVGSVTGLGAGVATFLATPSSANLLAALTTKTGTGSAVFGTAPTIDSLNATTAMTLAFITGSTQCLQVNTSGVISGTGAVCGGSGSTGANPTATAGPTANNGVATTFMRSDASPAVQQGSSSQKGIVQVDGTTITASSGVISAPPIVTSRSVTVTTDTILAADNGNIVYYNSASAVAITQPAPSGSFASGFFVTICNVNAGTLTDTPASGTIGGAASVTVLAGTELQPNCLTYQSNGTNFRLVPNYGTRTIGSGTAALGTSAITSGSCATAVTVAAANVATTDRIEFTPNADITAVTGYSPVTAGGLAIYPYPTSGNVNFKVCNPTSSSITPGAVTLNWSVTR